MKGKLNKSFPLNTYTTDKMAERQTDFFSVNEKMLRRGCQVKFFSSTEFRSKYSKISFLQMIPFFFRKYVILSDLMRQ